MNKTIGGYTLDYLSFGLGLMHIRVQQTVGLGFTHVRVQRFTCDIIWDSCTLTCANPKLTVAV